LNAVLSKEQGIVQMASDYSADVVVVGTGVVGCLIAEQALEAGLSVLMLEAGPRVDRWQIVENFRNLPPSLRLFHWDAPYPPKPWAPHLETRVGKESEQYLQLEGRMPALISRATFAMREAQPGTGPESAGA
jgi:choline dehydrogenase-like flavoprotein